MISTKMWIELEKYDTTSSTEVKIALDIYIRYDESNKINIINVSRLVTNELM